MKAIRVEVRSNGVAVVTLDDPARPVNTLSQSLVDDFNAGILPVLDDDTVRAVVVASAKKDFIAGADLKALLATGAAHEAARFSREGNALLSRIASSSKPVVAAIHGAALGGGLEVALACHYLLASSDTSTVLALPEVMLGLLPAGGGTQRLPRRIGLLAALPMLLTGRRVRVRRARRLGLVDAVTTPGGLVDTAVKAAEMLADGALARPSGNRSLADRLAARSPARSVVLRRARKEVESRTRGLYPAPLAVLECVETGLARGIDAGLACESQHFGELVASAHGKNLIRLFLGMQELKRPPASGAAAVGRLGVLGAGLMGAGIASVSVGRWPVVLRDISYDALTPACRSIRSGLSKQVRSGAITGIERDRRWARLLATTRLDDLAGCDLVVEAVFEDLDLKRRVIAEIEDLLDPAAVIASNTSALPIAAIAAGSRHPERILGMHYFSPVPKMPLLEVVVAAATSSEATATARAVGVAQGKSVIVVKDSPGFYTTRILAPYLNEAVTLIEEGAAIDDVDAALKSVGFPVGPVALIDEVGIDVGAHVAADLGAAFAARGVSSSDALPRLAEAGFAGRKNRRGFYLYPEGGGGRRRPNPEIYRRLGSPDRRPFDADDIASRCLLLMVNEAVHTLQDEVIASPRDGDIGAILGLGFPPFRGGPFRYIDAEGAAAVCDRLDGLADRLGPRFEPAPLLRDTARSGAAFHTP